MQGTCLLLLALAASPALLVRAACPNDCSGNGYCNPFSACECYRNWMGNDCSQRLCYFDRAFVDTPLGDLNSNGQLDPIDPIPVMSGSSPTHELFSHAYGLAKYQDTEETEWSEAHFYAECSGKGICDRASGQCACFEGYEGEGCTRVACPTATDEACSGHGTCQRLVDRYGESYKSWDALKTQHCVCDSGYTGIACDKRVCPSGDDPITKYLKTVTVCGTFVRDVGILDLEIGSKVYGTLSGASASLRSHDGSSCVVLVNEDGMFTRFENVISRDSVEIVRSVSSVSRAYDEAVEQTNEVQTVEIRAIPTNAFALTFVDEYGSSFTTRSIECDGSVACETRPVTCVVDDTDSRFAATDASAICGAYDATEDEGVSCAAQTYDIAGGCSWSASDIPDDQSVAETTCGAETDSIGCAGATYLSGGVSVSCDFVDPAVDGGTCVALLPRSSCRIRDPATDNADAPNDPASAEATCTAVISSRVDCESERYLTVANENVTCIWDRRVEESRCAAASRNYDTCTSETFTANDVGATSLACVVATWPPAGREQCRLDVESALEDLPSDVLRDVDVRDATPDDPENATFAYDTMSLDVHFVKNSGDLDTMVAIGNQVVDGIDGSAHVSIEEKIKGTTENAVCSNRGVCDYSTGACKCFQGFTRHDCSKQNALAMY